MTKELSDTMRRYGFMVPNAPSVELFDMIPVYPETTTVMKLADTLDVTPKRVHDIIRRMPAGAPVFSENGEVGRWK